jgi:hypothetical protein
VLFIVILANFWLAAPPSSGWTTAHIQLNHVPGFCRHFPNNWLFLACIGGYFQEDQSISRGKLRVVAEKLRPDHGPASTDKHDNCFSL